MKYDESKTSGRAQILTRYVNVEFLFVLDLRA